MPVKGSYLLMAGIGGIFLWSGVQGKSITGVIRELANGDSPSQAGSASQIKTATTGLGGILGSAAGGVSLPKGGNAGSNVASYQAYAFSLFPSFGWGTDQQQPLISLWNRESGWDPTAYYPGSHTTNPDDSHAFGIPQALPASKMASAGPDWRTNPATQIRWGLGYIHNRYGSPALAWAHEEANNSY